MPAETKMLCCGGLAASRESDAMTRPSPWRRGQGTGSVRPLSTARSSSIETLFSRTEVAWLPLETGFKVTVTINVKP